MALSRISVNVAKSGSNTHFLKNLSEILCRRKTLS
jgi:hypothetical protein